MAKDHTGRKFFLVAAASAAAGLITGFLTAPKSGKETRDDIKRKADEISQEAEKRLKTLHKELSDHVTQLKSKAKGLSKKAQSTHSELIDELEDGKERARKAISSLRAGDNEEVDALITELEKLKKKLAK